MILLAGIVALSACASEPVEDSNPTDGVETPEGEVKRDAGKADAWNWRNDPTRFRTELNYDFSKLPLKAQAPITRACSTEPMCSPHEPQHEQASHAPTTSSSAIAQAPAK